MYRRSFLQSFMKATVGVTLSPLVFVSSLVSDENKDEEEWDIETVLSAKLLYSCSPEPVFLIEFQTEDDDGIPIPLDEAPFEFPFKYGHKQSWLIDRKYLSRVIPVLGAELRYKHLPRPSVEIVLRTERAYGHRFYCELFFEYGHPKQWFIDFNYSFSLGLPKIRPGTPWAYYESERPTVETLTGS